jgi:hypothetical protein
MKGDLWLAVGDQTGNWDDLTDPKQFLSVALVLGKVSDWEAALKEEIKEQTIEQCMKQPLGIRSDDSTSNIHHVMDALNYFKAQSVRGRWALDREVKGSNSSVAQLKNQLCTHLSWLATHSLLVTVGTHGNAKWIKNNLYNAKESNLCSVGKAYGLLLTLLIPFLKEDDSLLFIPNGVWNTQLDSTQVASPAPDSESATSNLNHLISGLDNYTQQNLRVWQRTKMAPLHSGTFMDLQPNYFKDIPLDREAVSSIADLGSGLAALSQNSAAEIRVYDPNKTWHNVKFFQFEELLP